MLSEKMYFPNLSKARLLRGYTQKNMQILLEYKTVSRYAQYEIGERIPNVLEALRIAKVLGESVEYLFVPEVKTRRIEDPSNS